MSFTKGCSPGYPSASRTARYRLRNGDAGDSAHAGSVLRFGGNCGLVLCSDGIGAGARRCRYFLDDYGNGAEALHGARPKYFLLYWHIDAARHEHHSGRNRRACFAHARFLGHRHHLWRRGYYGRMAGGRARESTGV
jgi:hypothetical protein